MPSDFDVIDALRERAARLDRATAAFLDSQAEPLREAATSVVDTLRAGRTVFTCGNGGSTALAMHIETELLARYQSDRRPLPCLFLGAAASTITATANDYAFEDVFARPLEALGREGDLLIALTTSGTSPNVIRALEVAEARGLQAILVTGDRAPERSGVVLRWPGDGADQVQDGHQLLVHALMDAVEAELGA
ncbi:MAG: SIS domain-containing protein [Thermoleophilaceae bacterium]